MLGQKITKSLQQNEQRALSDFNGRSMESPGYRAAKNAGTVRTFGAKNNLKSGQVAEYILQQFWIKVGNRWTIQHLNR